MKLECLYRVEDLSAAFPNAFRSAGALRWAIFRHREELELAGVIVRFGRRLLIDKGRFEGWLAAKNGLDAGASE